MATGTEPEYAIQNVRNRNFERIHTIIDFHFVPHCGIPANEIAARRTKGGNAKAAPQRQVNWPTAGQGREQPRPNAAVLGCRLAESSS